MTCRLPHTTASLCPCISRISNVIPCLTRAWNFASLPFGCSLIAYNTLIATVSLSCQCYCCFQHFCLTPSFLTSREHPRSTSQSHLHSWSCTTGPFSGFRIIYPTANRPSIGSFPRNLQWNVSQIFPLNFLSHQIIIHQVKMVIVWKSKWILPSLSLQLNQSSIGASFVLTHESDSTFLSVQPLPQIRPSALFPWTTPSVISRSWLIISNLSS